MAQKKDSEKSNVIPFPQGRSGVKVELVQPEPMEPVMLLDHPDVQVIQEAAHYFRVRVGEVELTYDCSFFGQGAWYVRLPGHEHAVKPLTVEQYDPENQPNMINIDRDKRGAAVGIEII